MMTAIGDSSTCPTLWAFIAGLRGLRLRHAGRLRPRHRHAVSFAKDDDERDQMMASIAPFWDGNETWLVIGGGGLLVAFPLGLRDHHAGALSAGDRDAAGARVPRRRLRVSRAIGANKACGTRAFAGGSIVAALPRA